MAEKSVQVVGRFRVKSSSSASISTEHSSTSHGSTAPQTRKDTSSSLGGDGDVVGRFRVKSSSSASISTDPNSTSHGSSAPQTRKDTSSSLGGDGDRVGIEFKTDNVVKKAAPNLQCPANAGAGGEEKERVGRFQVTTVTTPKVQEKLVVASAGAEAPQKSATNEKPKVVGRFKVTSQESSSKSQGSEPNSNPAPAAPATKVGRFTVVTDESKSKVQPKAKKDPKKDPDRAKASNEKSGVRPTSGSTNSTGSIGVQPNSIKKNVALSAFETQQKPVPNPRPTADSAANSGSAAPTVAVPATVDPPPQIHTPGGVAEGAPVPQVQGKSDGVVSRFKQVTTMNEGQDGGNGGANMVVADTDSDADSIYEDDGFDADDAWHGPGRTQEGGGLVRKPSRFSIVKGEVGGDGSTLPVALSPETHPRKAHSTSPTLGSSLRPVPIDLEGDDSDRADSPPSLPGFPLPKKAKEASRFVQHYNTPAGIDGKTVITLGDEVDTPVSSVNSSFTYMNVGTDRPLDTGEGSTVHPKKISFANQQVGNPQPSVIQSILNQLMELKTSNVNTDKMLKKIIEQQNASKGGEGSVSEIKTNVSVGAEAKRFQRTATAFTTQVSDMANQWGLQKQQIRRLQNEKRVLENQLKDAKKEIEKLSLHIEVMSKKTKGE